MRFVELQLHAFGKFSGKTLAFGRDAGRLHVIYGPNEAGKSTILRAFSGFLYEIPVQSNDTFLHKGTDLRIGATLVDHEDQQRTFVRRKGRKETLLESNNPVPEAELSVMLRGITKDVFEREFRLNHPLIVAGGNELAAGQGDLASSLFQAGAGVLSVRKLLEELDEEAEKLFKARGSNPVINNLIDSYKNAKKLRDENMLSAKDWTDLDKNRVVAERDAELVRVELEKTKLRLRRNEQICACFELVHDRSDLESRLAQYSGAIRISKAQRSAFQQTLEKRDKAREQAALLEAQISHTKCQLDELPKAAEISYERNAIKSLLGELQVYRNAIRDLPKRRQEQAAIVNEATLKLARVIPGFALENVDQFVLSEARNDELQYLASKFTKLDAQRDQLNAEVRQLTQECQPSFDDSDEIAPAKPKILEQHVKRARLAGDIPAGIETEERKLKSLLRRANDLTGKLHPWQGDFQEISRLPIPSKSVIRDWEKLFESLRSKLDQNDEEQTTISNKLAQVDQELLAQVTERAVPTDAELQEARARRDSGWRLVRNSLLQETLSAQDEAAIRNFRGDVGLEQAYERAVLRADQVVDQLRADADRVASRAGLEAKRVTEQARLERLASGREEIVADIDRQQLRWNQLWEGCHFVPLEPAMMVDWAQNASELSEVAEKVAEIQQTIVDMKLRWKGHCDQIRAELTQVIGPVDSSITDEVILEFAERTISDSREQEKVHERTKSARKERERQLKQKTDLLNDYNKAIEAWNEEWKRATADLPTEGLAPANVLTMTQAILHAVTSRETIRDWDQRIQEMQSSCENFELQARELAKKLLPEKVDSPPDTIANLLAVQVQQADSDEVRRSTLQAELDKRQSEFVVQHTAFEREQATLLRLLNDAGIADEESWSHRCDESEAAENLESRLADINQQLRRAAGGIDLEDLIVGVERTSTIELENENGHLTAEIGQLEHRNSECQRRLGELQNEKRRLEELQGAYEKAQDVQSVLCQIRSRSEEYMRLKLASVLLRKHLEIYRQQNQDPVLKRASDLFCRLTCGGFQGMKSDYNEKDVPVLRGIRKSGEEVDVDGLSSGTRDQMFLSLRLASLERQIDATAKIPLIVDDILINFDDDRSKATLDVLAELAQQTQVLFFTHHPRMVELARETLDSAQLSVIELDS